MDRHLTRIHGLAWYMLGDTHEAEDIAQETFLRFWQAAPKWREDGTAKISTWLHRVASRQCIDRKRRKAPVYSDRLPERIDGTLAPEAALSRTQSETRVRLALDALNARQRTAIVLSYYQDLSQADACDIMGVTQKAFESLLVRARQNLKAELLPERSELEL